MAILKEKYKKEIIDKLPNFSELQIKEILNFVNYLEKEIIKKPLMNYKVNFRKNSP